MKMKKMSAMKSMKMKKAMKVSIIGKKASVFKGLKSKTKSGLKKSDLKKSKAGKIVSIKKSAAGKKSWKLISKWHEATVKARKALGIKGFVPIGGKTAKGQ